MRPVKPSENRRLYAIQNIVDNFDNFDTLSLYIPSAAKAAQLPLTHRFLRIIQDVLQKRYH